MDTTPTTGTHASDDEEFHPFRVTPIHADGTPGAHHNCGSYHQVILDATTLLYRGCDITVTEMVPEVPEPTVLHRLRAADFDFSGAAKDGVAGELARILATGAPVNLDNAMKITKDCVFALGGERL
jgi:hypothetical protein